MIFKWKLLRQSNPKNGMKKAFRTSPYVEGK
jgi:hypothetical protein